MKRTHAFLISVVLAFAVILGSFAAIRSTQLSTAASKPRVGATEIARQNAALTKAESALRAQLAHKPPPLPRTNAAATAAAPQTVIYRRAPTIVHVVHRHGGEHEDGGSGGVDD